MAHKDVIVKTPGFDYAIRRSKRRTVAIHVESAGVIVRAPARMPESRVREFVESKSDWIIVKLAESNRRKT